MGRVLATGKRIFFGLRNTHGHFIKPFLNICPSENVLLSQQAEDTLQNDHALVGIMLSRISALRIQMS